MRILSFLLVALVWISFGWTLIKCLNLKKWPILWLVCIPSMFGLLFINNPLIIIKIGVFVGALLFVAYYDYQTKTIPRFIHWIILITGFIGVDLFWIINQGIPGMLLLPLPVIAVYLYQKKKEPTKNIGIGDIKLIAACGFVVGMDNGLFGLFIGLALALLWCLIKRIDKSSSFPFAPFLCLGFTISYALNVL